ncbi:hypothetical protein KC345_g175 [Hortaea werneckii]|nr:hypothetical protein KC345_g175 [Hortaea werneckii]
MLVLLPAKLAGTRQTCSAPHLITSLGHAKSSASQSADFPTPQWQGFMALAILPGRRAHATAPISVADSWCPREGCSGPRDSIVARK